MTTYAEIISEAVLAALGPDYDPDRCEQERRAASSGTAGSLPPVKRKAERRSKGSATK